MGLVEEFVKHKKGRSAYTSWLKAYFDILDIKDPNTYFDDNRNYDKDIITFAESTKHWAPATRKASIACVKNFFMFNDAEIRPKTRYTLRELKDGPSAIFAEKVPEREELKEILSFGSVLHKAIFLTMASGGLRPGEAVALSLNDVDVDSIPARISVPWYATRTKKGRITFISSEAKHYVIQWLKIRSKYIASKRNNVHEDDNRLFPMSYNNMNMMWNNLLIKSEHNAIDKNNINRQRRYLMTPHKLRKFFKTQLSDAGIPFEASEILMGHDLGMMGTYAKPTDKQLRNWYLKGEPNLLIFEKAVNEDEINELRKQMATLQSQLISILESQENYEFEDRDGDPVKIPVESVVEQVQQKIKEANRQ